MRRALFAVAFACGMLVLGSEVQAEEGGAGEALPQQRLVAPAWAVPGPTASPVPYYPKKSAYDVWQNYGVDRQGHFRPLVIYSPYGAYYRYNGAPFPWASTHPLEFSLTIVGSPPPMGPAPEFMPYTADYMPYTAD